MSKGSRARTKRSGPTGKPEHGLTVRGAANLGLSLLAVVLVAVIINWRTTSGPVSTNAATATTPPPSSPLAIYERTLRMEVAAYVGYGQHVESLMRRPADERLDSELLASEAAPFVEIISDTMRIVEKLAAPEQAKQARAYALQSGAVLQSSLTALRDTSLDPRVRLAMTARLKLLADRIFDRVRVSLDRAAQPDLENAAVRLRVQNAAPDYEADGIAPFIGGMVMPAPPSEAEVDEQRWRDVVSAQATIIADALSADAPDAAVLARSAELLALRLVDESRTEAGRVFRLAALVGVESALARQQGATSLADDLARQSRDLWGAATDGLAVPKLDHHPQEGQKDAAHAPERRAEPLPRVVSSTVR